MILISTQCFPPVLGGIETLVYSLSSALAATDEGICVFADYHTASDSEFDKRQTFPIYRYSGLKPLRRRKKASDIVQNSNSRGTQRFSLITDSWKSLEHVGTTNFSVVLCLAHGSEIPLQPSVLKALRIRKAFSKATYIVANSSYTANRIKPYVDNPEKIRVILPGISAPTEDQKTELAVRQKLSGHDPILITIARLEPRKGHMSVINLLPRLVEKFPTLLYVIAGEGSCRHILEKAAAHNGVTSHVLFIGRIEDPAKTAWLKSSTLFVMPGTQVGKDVEGFGLAYIEAALQGIPSVACNAGGAAEAVLHRQTGLVCKPDDNEKLVQTMLELLGNRPYCNQLGMNARARAGSFLWQKKYQEYLQILSG